MTPSRNRGRPAKPSPNDVIEAARSRLVERFTIYKMTDQVLLGGDAQLHQARVVNAEEALHAIAVTVEDTISKWCISTVKSNGRPALENIEKTVENVAKKSARDKIDSLGIPTRYKLSVSVSIAAPGERGLKPSEVEHVIDPSGRNLTFASKEKWDRWVGMNVPDPYKKRAHLLNEEDWITMQYVKLLRNYVAHRSASSLTELNHMIALLRKKQAGYRDIYWPGKRIVKNQSGSHAGDLLLATPSTSNSVILDLIFARITTLLLDLKV